MATTALQYFSILDNSIRPNVILNCPNMIPLFNEEDMKCIDYSKITSNYLNTSKFDCNVILSVQNQSEDIQNLCTQSINEFEPVYYCTINTDPIIHDILLKANYTFVCNKYLLYIYKK
jgi:hypothetical protein